MNIYYINKNEIMNSYLLNEYPNIIKESSFLRNKIISKYVLSFLINTKYGIPHENIGFGTNIYGKPFLKENTNIHFNVSHSENYMICVFDSSEIGIDLEFIKNIDLNIAKKFFLEEENKYINLKPDESIKRLYIIWTRKESYLKLLGVGLSWPLKSFSTVNDEIKTTNKLYYFKSFNIFDNSICTICSSKAIKRISLCKVNLNEIKF